MDIVSLTLFTLTACVLLRVLSSESREIKAVCAIFAACLIAAHFLDGFYTISQALSELFEQTSLSEGYIGIIFKSLGICYITQLGCDCCRDSGENALASQLELAGKAALMITALPLLNAAIETIRQLLIY